MHRKITPSRHFFFRHLNNHGKEKTSTLAHLSMTFFRRTMFIAPGVAAVTRTTLPAAGKKRGEPFF
jgi:hypothetical protein